MLSVLALILALQYPSGSYGRILPADDGAKDASFREFRRQLLAAVERKDVSYIVSTLDSKILNSFGGDGGIKEFREKWKLDRPSNSPLWRELKAALNLGSGIASGEICAPYVYTHSPEGPELDGFDTIVVIKKDAPAFSRPNEAAPVRLHYSYDVLKKARVSSPGWWQIEVASGRTLYVHRSDARSPIDYRACFAKRAGRWVMTALVAGD